MAIYNEFNVKCWQIIARRGRQVRAQRQQQKFDAFVLFMNEWLGEPSNIEWPEDDAD